MSLRAKLDRFLWRRFGPKLRIAVVASQIVPHDGVSNAVRDTVRAVAQAGRQVSVFTAKNGFGALPAEIVKDAGALARSRAFQSADVILYHYALYHDLFELIRAGNGNAVQIVLFHNVTPEALIADALRPMVAASFAQIQYFHQADRLWPFSKTNAQVLLDAGLDPGRIEIVDPVIPWPPRKRHAEKAGAPIQVLFVGRITKSKGVLDLLDAVERVNARCAMPFRVSLVGRRAEDSYYAAVQSRCAQLAPLVELVGECDNGELERRYHAAHILSIPSYHEGFCRPVAEGLRAGCVPVGFASYNLPLTAGGLGRLVAPGNIAALAAALQSMIENVAAARSLPLDRGPTTIAEFDALAGRHAARFNFDRFSRTVIRGIRGLARSRTAT